MSFDSGKKKPTDDTFAADDYSSMLLPFINNANSKKAADVPTVQGGATPLNTLRQAVKQNVSENKQQESARLNDEEQALKTVAEKVNPKSEKPKKSSPAPKTKTSTLLAKCMPYIYDDGINYAEEKPDYTLESVEDIIESAEKRADEKIARMYRIKTSDIQRIGDDAPAGDPPQKAERKPRLRLEETSIKKPLRIGETQKNAAKVFYTASFPKVSETLFDDFSARRTDVSGEENVTTPYLVEGGMDFAEDGHTRAIPDLKPKTENNGVFEDIVSHTRPMNVEDISSYTKKPAVKVTSFSEEETDIKVDDFKGQKDINRVGSSLKLDCFTSRIRLVLTAILTAVAIFVHLPIFNSTAESVTLSIISIIVFAVAMLVNFNVFAGFKGAFTRNTRIEFPLALAGTAMTSYFVYSTIVAQYDFTPALIPLISFLFYDYCAYRKAVSIFGNFKLVALRRSKSAVTLVDDASTTSAMARSTISGEILAAGQQTTEEIDDFLKNTLSGRPFGGKLNVFSIVNCSAAIILACAVGLNYGSVSAGLLVAAVILCLGAMPTLFISDMLPFAGLCDRLHKHRAAVCSKYSAEKIEQINAAVISSAELFPKGCVKLYNMSALSANSIDETILLAAAVAQAADSPLYPMLEGILTDDTELPEADSVKYEDTLGISGWVGNTHILIGNRSLMQAHGVRVPALDVDRKILHKGYFPVYIACEERACALLMVGYTPDRTIEYELGKLGDRGVTLLVSNCDPNITEQMLCDYYGLYPDIVKILDHNGKHKYEKRTEPSERASAHAFHKGDSLSFLSILTGCFRIHTLSTVLYVLHIIAAVVMWLLFAGMSLGGTMTLMSISLCALCELVCIVISLTAYFVGK